MLDVSQNKRRISWQNENIQEWLMMAPKSASTTRSDFDSDSTDRWCIGWSAERWRWHNRIWCVNEFKFMHTDWLDCWVAMQFLCICKLCRYIIQQQCSRTREQMYKYRFERNCPIVLLLSTLACCWDLIEVQEQSRGIQSICVPIFSQLVRRQVIEPGCEGKFSTEVVLTEVSLIKSWAQFPNFGEWERETVKKLGQNVIACCTVKDK